MIKTMLSCVLTLAFCFFHEAYGKQQELQSQNGTDGGTADSSGIRFTGGDGSSMEKAIVIAGAKNELEAVPAEIGYISERHGERDRSWKMIMQSDFRRNERVYVQYQIEDFRKGIRTAYFFDNTSLYSAYLETPKRPQKETVPQSRTDVEVKTETAGIGIRFGGGDGSSMDNAVIIYGAKNKREAAGAEIGYISRRHGEKDGSWKMTMRSDFRKNGRAFVECRIEDLRKGTKRVYFFEHTPLNSAYPAKTTAMLPAQPKQPQREAVQPSRAVEAGTERKGFRYRGGDGSSMEKAVIIYGVKNEREIAAAEFGYISRRHGRKDLYWEKKMQSNFRKNQRHYQEINIKDLRSGERFDYFFDVTEVSGK